MSALDHDIKFGTAKTRPPGFTPAEISTAAFHAWGGKEYLNFYSADLSIPTSELPRFCEVLNGATIGEYITIEGTNWGGSHESQAAEVTEGMLSVLSWHIALHVTASRMENKTKEEQRTIFRETMERWDTGKWPFRWK